VFPSVRRDLADEVEPRAGEVLKSLEKESVLIGLETGSRVGVKGRVVSVARLRRKVIVGDKTGTGVGGDIGP